MARFLLFTQFLLLSFAALSLASASNQIKAVPNSQRAGVFMLIDAGKYTFNFTAARAACLFLNVTIATMTQMERAVQRGLETCKFGWIDGQVSVIPRLTADQKCGKGNTGVVVWKADPARRFGVFCFNASDLEETHKTSTPSPQTASSASLVETTQTLSPAATPLLRSTSEAPSSRKPKTPEPPQRLTLTSAFTLLIKTTPSTGFSSTSPPLKPFTTRTATSPSHLTTSSSAVSSESVLLQPVGSVKPSLGAVPIALIVIGILFLILTAAGVVWYYTLSRRQQKQDIKMEMWKPTDTEMELHSQHEAEKEDDAEATDRDVMLFVNPDIKTASE